MLAYISWSDAYSAFDLGPVHLRWYSLLFVSGLWIAYGLSYLIYKREGIDIERLHTLWIGSVIAAVVGARLGEVIFYDPQTYIEDPIKVFKIWEGGLASHGATIALTGWIGWYAYKRMGKTLMWLGDHLVAGISGAAACIRLGNFMNAEIVGRETTHPWGVIFSNYDNIPRHPIQLYECFCYIVLAATLFFLFPKYKQKVGLSSGLFFTGMFGTRFFLEFFKENNSVLTENFPLTMGQLLSLPLALIGLYLIFRKKKS